MCFDKLVLGKKRIAIQTIKMEALQILNKIIVINQILYSYYQNSILNLIMLLFKNIKGERVDPVNHTLEVIKNYPYAEIHIGTDSQNINKETHYTTVIAYRLGTRGVHYILSRSSKKIIRDMWTRLWKEAEYSIDVAEWMTQKITIKLEIDMDYNGDENFKSHKLISAAKGWANSLGYKVNVKPNNQIATRAADYHCK
ncbi:MAG: hypothetical protein CBD76_03750 [Pelagibacteraceae bacterium TMED216]|nr:MAG: hypothetical protein CBD76_03750 [Pelagibacteraceae bacterium TMED216]|tara:strand:- start:2453 stop:3046 length:594 start_codon:yes stop_codon:yes gene_type:complete